MDSTRALSIEQVTQREPWLPPEHLLPPELVEPLADYRRLLDDAQDRRDALLLARQAVEPARHADAAALRDRALSGETTLERGHDKHARAALAKVASATAANNATVDAARVALGKVRGLLVKYGDQIEAAAKDHALETAGKYGAVLDDTLALRSAYVGALAAWHRAARAGATARYERAKSDGELIGAAFDNAGADVQASFLRWSPSGGRLVVGNREVDGGLLAAALHEEAKRHIEPAPRKRNTDDRILAGEKPTRRDDATPRGGAVVVTP